MAELRTGIFRIDGRMAQKIALNLSNNNKQTSQK
jgi:hypothetical protein